MSMVVNREASPATEGLPASWVQPSPADRLSILEGELGARRGAQLPGGQPDSATLANIRERVFNKIGFAPSSPTEASPAQQSQASTAPAQEEQ